MITTEHKQLIDSSGYLVLCRQCEFKYKVVELTGTHPNITTIRVISDIPAKNWVDYELYIEQHQKKLFTL